MVVLLLSSFTACTTESSSETESMDKQQVKKEAGSLKLDEHSHYKLLKLYKDSHAMELMKTYGAHSLGIRWKTHQGVNTDQLALAFYIDKIKAVDGSNAYQSVPASITIVEEGSEAVIIQTEVILSSQAVPEQ